MPGGCSQAHTAEQTQCHPRHAFSLHRMLEQVDERPSQGGHQVRHRGDVDERDVEPDSADPHVIGFRRPCIHDPAEQSSSPTSPEVIPRAAVSTTATTSSNAAHSACLPDAATAAIVSGCTKASEPSRVSKARTNRSNE